METNNGRIRKPWKWGVVTQTPMCIKVDNDLLPWLKEKPNKALYINNLIREDMEREGR